MVVHHLGDHPVPRAQAAAAAAMGEYHQTGGSGRDREIAVEQGSGGWNMDCIFP
jgi:hypothetical protein